MIKILLADDETDSRDAIAQYIDWEGHGLELVGAAGDGAEALEMIKTRKPDIAILDIYMPKLSGIQVIERCRREMPDAPAFIIISGYNDFGCAQQAIRLKVEEYLLKPFLARELMDAVQRALLQVELRRGGAGGHGCDGRGDGSELSVLRQNLSFQPGRIARFGEVKKIRKRY